MRRFGVVFVSCVVALVVARGDASAVVMCPDGEPGFPYVDDGNGCFDVGTDTEIPLASLLGMYTAPAGKSLVIPKKAKIVGPPGTMLEWHANNIFVRGKVTTTDGELRIIADNFYEVLGKLSATGVGGNLLLQCSMTPCPAPSTIGAKAAIEGSGNVTVGTNLAIQMGVKIETAANLSVNNFTSIGEKVKLLAAGQLTLFGHSTSAIIEDKVSLFAMGGTLSVGIAGSTPLSIGDGVKLIGNPVSLSFAGDMAIGDKVRFTCGLNGCNLGNGGSRTLGSNLKMISESTVSMSGPTFTTIGTGAKIIAASTISISQGGPLSIGEGAKIESLSSISLGGGGAVTTLAAGSKVVGSTISFTGSQVLIGNGCALTGVNNTGFSSSGLIDIGAGTKIESGSISFGNGGNLVLGEGVKANATTASLSTSSGGILTVSDGCKLSGVGVSLSASTSRSIGVGVKVDAATGSLGIGSGGPTAVAAKTKFIGGSVSFSHAGTLDLGEDCSVTSTNGSLSIGNGADVIIRAGSTLSAAGGGLSISNALTRQIGDGVTIASTSGVSLSGGGATALGAGVAIDGQSVSLSAGGADLSAGDGLSIESTVGGTSFSSGTGITIGNKSAVKSADSITLGGGGNLTIGDKGKLKSATVLSIGNGGSTTVGISNKWTSTGGDVSVTSSTGIDIGAGSKLSAGDQVSLAAGSGTLHLDEKVKLRSGTLDDPMLPASEIHLNGSVVQLDPKVGLSGADGINLIAIAPATTLSAQEAMIAGKTITIGVASPSLTSFTFTSNKVKGSDDGATVAFQAPSAACNLTGTKFSNIAVDTTGCMSVVGP